MLSLVDLDAGRLNYYLTRARFEYLQGDHAEGVYYGRGATALGLSGNVKAKEFRSLCNGFLDGKQLVRSAGTKKHYPGVDLCFSVPKSVSCYWAVSDSERRDKIESCHDRAVKAALDYLEEETRVRVGTGGKERIPAGIVAALWMHGTARPAGGQVAPNLHTHVTLFNVGVTPDGKTRTICGEVYFSLKMAAGALYRTEVSKLVEKELGLTVYRPIEKSWFEIKGVPETEMERLSPRSKEIAKHAKENGLYGAEGKQISTLATREAKKATPMKKLFAEWRRDARDHGFTQESVPIGPVPERDHLKEETEALTNGLRNVTRTSTHFAKRDLVKEVSIESQGRGLGSKEVLNAVTKTLENSTEVVRLGTVKNEERFTTNEALAIERGLLDRVKDAKGKDDRKVSKSTVLQAILETQKEASLKLGRKVELTAEQVSGVKRLTNGEEITILSGDFGTGKVLTANTAKRAFEIAGYRCIETGRSLAVSRILRDLDLGIIDQAKHHIEQLGRAAASSLRDDFRGTITGALVGALAKYTPLGKVLPKPRKTYAFDPVTIDEKTVVIVHDAQAVGVKEMDELTRKVRERGGRLCLVGNQNAPPPLQGVSTFSALSRTLGEARLTKNFRQQKADQKALHSLTEAKAAEALQSFASRGLLHIATNQAEALSQMVWLC